MNRFFKLTVLFATLASVSVLSDESFAKGHAGGQQVTSHRIVSHRINEYPGGRNPDQVPGWPPLGIPGGNSNPPVNPPVKHHPFPVGGLQPVAFPK
jgi:hypothetical protein